MDPAEGKVKEIKQEIEDDYEEQPKPPEEVKREKSQEEAKKSTVEKKHPSDSLFERLQGPNYLVPRDLCSYILNTTLQTEENYKKVIKTSYKNDDRLVVVIREYPEKHLQEIQKGTQELAFVVDSRTTVAELEEEINRMLQVNETFLKIQLYYGNHKAKLDEKKRHVFLRQIPRTVQDEFIIWFRYIPSDPLKEQIERENNEMLLKKKNVCGEGTSSQNETQTDYVEDNEEMPSLSVEAPGEEAIFEEREESSPQTSSERSNSGQSQNNGKQSNGSLRSSQTCSVSYHDLPLGRTSNNQNRVENAQEATSPSTLCRQISEHFKIPFIPNPNDPLFPLKIKKLSAHMAREKIAYNDRVNILKCWEQKIRNFDQGEPVMENNRPATREELIGEYKQIRNGLDHWIEDRPERARRVISGLESAYKQSQRNHQFNQSISGPNQRHRQNRIFLPNASIVNANGSRENANDIVGRLIRVPTAPTPGAISFQMNQSDQSNPKMKQTSINQQNVHHHVKQKTTQQQKSVPISPCNFRPVPGQKKDNLFVSIPNKDYPHQKIKWQYKNKIQLTGFDPQATITAIYEYRQLSEDRRRVGSDRFLNLYYFGVTPAPVFGAEYDLTIYNLYYSRRQCDKANVIIKTLDAESQTKLFELNLHPLDPDPKKRKIFFELIQMPIKGTEETEESEEMDEVNGNDERREMNERNGKEERIVTVEATEMNEMSEKKTTETTEKIAMHEEEKADKTEETEQIEDESIVRKKTPKRWDKHRQEDLFISTQETPGNSSTTPKSKNASLISNPPKKKKRIDDIVQNLNHTINMASQRNSCEPNGIHSPTSSEASGISPHSNQEEENSTSSSKSVDVVVSSTSI